MFSAYAVLAVLLALVCLGSSIADIKKMPTVVEAQDRLNVPPRIRQVIPIAKALGGLGLLIGLGVAFLGVLSAVCLVAYFVIATGFHRRAGDRLRDTGPAAALAVLSAAAAVARLASM